MGNYISQVPVWGKKKKNHVAHELLVKLWGPKANAVPLVAEMGFDLSCVSI